MTSVQIDLSHIPSVQIISELLPAYVTNTVAEITGTPARTLFDWASDHAQAFRA